MLHLETLATNRKLTKLVALGEMGLDYSDKNVVKRDLQKKVFRLQLEMAIRRKLPVVLHIRDAEEDGYEVRVIVTL